MQALATISLNRSVKFKKKRHQQVMILFAFLKTEAEAGLKRPRHTWIRDYH